MTRAPAGCIVALIGLLTLVQTQAQAAVSAAFTPGDTTLTAAGADPLPYLTASPTWTVSFDGTGSADAPGGITSFAWDYGYDGVPADFVGTDSAYITPTHTFTAPGTYLVALQVTGADGTVITTHTITIPATDAPPVASAGKYLTPFGTAYAANGVWTVPLDATATTDPDVNVNTANLFYIWGRGPDTFPGTSIDGRIWQTGDTTVNNGVTVTGDYTWGHAYIFSGQPVTRAPGTAVEMTLTVPDAETMVGFANTTGGFSYSNMPYSLYLYHGDIYIQEFYGQHGSFGHINVGTVIDIRVELGPASGAFFSYRIHGTQPWIFIYQTTANTYTQLFAGVSQLFNPLSVASIDVQQGGTKPSLPVYPDLAAAYPQSATENLTVYDNAHDSATDVATVSVTAVTPVANAGPDQTLNESAAFHGGYTVTLNGTASTPATNLSYSWDLGANTFPGTQIDPSWNVTSAVAQNDGLIINNPGYWGQTAWSQGSVQRPLNGTTTSYEGVITFTGSSTMFGLSAVGNSRGYYGLTYGFYFTGGQILVYEDNNSRGTFGSYLDNGTYDVRIDLKSNQGATYYYRLDGDPTWILLYDSSYSSQTVFNDGADVYYGVLTISSLENFASGVQPTVTLVPLTPNAAMPVELTVTNGANQSATDAMVVQCNAENAPVAVLAAQPALGAANANLGYWQVDLNAAGSSDDFEIYTVAWDFDYDGSHFNPTVTTVVDGSGSAIQLQRNYYTTVGTHLVAAQVTDEALQVSNIATTPVVINLAAAPNPAIIVTNATTNTDATHAVIDKADGSASGGGWTVALSATGAATSNLAFATWDLGVDSFAGTSFADSKWLTFGNVVRNNGVTLTYDTTTGNDATLTGADAKDRSAAVPANGHSTIFDPATGLVMETTVTLPASTYDCIGFKRPGSTGTGIYNYTSAFLIQNSNLYAYDNGSQYGNGAIISLNSTMDFRIELRDSGARYLYRTHGVTAWTLLFDGAYDNSNPLVVACENDSGSMVVNAEHDYAAGLTPSVRLYGPGAHVVTLTATDQQGLSGTAAETVTLDPGVGPTVAVTPPVTNSDEAHGVHGHWNLPFDASTTFSPDQTNGIYTMEWDFNYDGTTFHPSGVTGFTANHIFTSTVFPVTFTIAVRATDNGLNQAIATATVHLTASLPPIADAGGPYIAAVGGPPVHFSGAGSTDDNGVVSYRWDVNTAVDGLNPADDDGTFDNDVDLVGVSPMFVYPASMVNLSLPFPQYITAKLTVADDAGQTNSQTVQVQIVQTLPPEVLTVPWRGNVNLPHPVVSGVPTRVKGIVRDAAQLANLQYQWDFGQPAPATGTITLNGVPADGDSVTITGSAFADTFEFDSDNLVSGSDIAVPIGVDGPTSAVALASAINADTNLGFTAVVTGSVVTVADTQAGAAGNLPLASTGSISVVGLTGGDDSATSAWTAVNDPRDLGLSRTYAGGVGRPFTATLTVKDTVNNVQASQSYLLQVVADTTANRGDLAVDEGLWYLHRVQAADGHWVNSGQGYPITSTSGSIQALEINGHLRSGNLARDPMAEDVDNGLNWLFTQCRANTVVPGKTLNTATGAVTYNPDGNLNGIGLDANTTQGNTDLAPYETGMVMDAIAASGEPQGLANASGPVSFHNGMDMVRGRQLGDILQDFVDMYCANQHYQGGWRYYWETTDSDNSFSQWGAIGMGAAEDNFGITIPPVVKSQNLLWVTSSQNFSGAPGPGSTFGYFGYGDTSSLGTGRDDAHATTPSGLVQLDFDGIPTSDARWQHGQAWIADNWPPTQKNSYYAMYALVKSMRLAKPAQVSLLQRTDGSTIDWYNDTTPYFTTNGTNPGGIRPYLVGQQVSDGSWNGTDGLSYSGTDSYMGSEASTAWAIIMLTPTLFVQPPVAVITAPTVWAFDRPLRFKGNQSYDSDATHHIVTYEWWFDYNPAANAAPDLTTTDPLDANAVYTYVDPDQANHDSNPIVHVVHLRVTDNNNPAQQDAVSFTITLAEPPHKPYAVPGGPYTGTAGVPITVNGSGSFDIDPSDYITQYGWDFTNSGSPQVFSGSPHTTGTGGAATPAANPYVSHIFASPGVYNIALTVWDDGVLTNDGNSIASLPQYTSVTVNPNVPPVVNVNGPYTVAEGQALTLNSNGSHDPNSDEPTSFQWTIGDTAGSSTSSVHNPTYTWNHAGTYVVSLTLFDTLLGIAADPLEQSATTSVTVTHVPPTAAFSFAPGVVKLGVSEQFTDLTYAPYAAITAWSWNLGSAGTSTLQNPTATYTATGPQTVSLTVTDAQGATATYSQGFTVIKTGVVITQSATTAVVKGGAGATYTAQLNSAPVANVTVLVHAPAALHAAPAILTFNAGNWNVPQTVTVTAPDDHIATGPQNVTITHTATSTDSDYNGIAVDSVPVAIGDIDAADLTIRDDYEATAAAGAVHVYQSSPTGTQVRAQYASASASATYVITLVNDNGITTTLVAKATGNAGQGWTVSATGPGGDITSALSGAGYTTGLLAPGASETLTLTVSPDATVVSGTIATITVTSGLTLADTVVRDVVRARTTASLLDDGTFEFPGLLGGTVTHGAGESIGPWTVGALLDHETGLAADGVQGVALQHGSIYQDLPVIPGTSYQLRFAVYGAGAQGLTATWGTIGGSVTDSFSVPDVAGWTSPTGWTYYNFTTSATAASGATARLSFADASVGVAGPVIDDVSMVVNSAASIQPDLLVKRSTDPVGSYVGDSLYQVAPAGVQILTQTITSGSALANVEVVNNSPYARSFLLLAAPTLNGTWTLSTTLDSDSSDLSAAFAGAGYTTPVLAPGGSVVIDVGLTPGNGTAFGASASVDLTVVADASDLTVRDAVRVVAGFQATPPAANPDNASVANGGTVVVPVLANDTDPNGLTLAVTAVGAAAHGTVTIVDANGLPAASGVQVSYAAIPGYTGADSFTYTVSDGQASATATVTISISSQSPPVAVADLASVASGAVVTVPVLNNDSDPYSLALTVISVTQPTHGAVTILDGTGTAATTGVQVAYAATLGYTGSDIFTYTISDGQSTATAQVTMTVTALPPPVAVNDSATVGAGGTVSIAVLANDTDPNGRPLSVTGTGAALHGTVTIVGGTTISYTATAGFTGNDSFTYTISDGAGSASATVNVAVASPQAVNDTAHATSGQPVIINVLANDHPLPNRPLAITAAGAPHHGTVTILGANAAPAIPGVELSYVSVGGYVGSDNFSYTASDGLASVTAQVSVTVTASTRIANPIAVNDAVTLPMGASTPISVLANDSDPQHLPLTITAVSHPAHGTAINTGSQVVYAGASGYAGIDTFTYTISNGTNTAIATVTVTLVPGISFVQSAGSVVKGMGTLSVGVSIPAPVTFAVTANVVLGTGTTAVTGQSPTVLETGDDLVLGATTVTIPAGATTAAYAFTVVDGPATHPNGVLANLVLTGPSAGAQPDFALTILDHHALQVSVNGAVATGTDDLGTHSVGSSFFVRVLDGVPPYSITSAGSNTFFTYVTGGLFGQFTTGDPNGDQSQNPYQQVLFSITGLGAGSLTISDATGTTVTMTYSATSPPQIALIPALPTLSVGAQTVYGAICPGTPEGLIRLRRALAGRDNTDIRMFSWDAQTQQSVEWPQEPLGGLQPSSGLFLATRSDLHLDFSGDAAPIFYTLTLRPGWNLLGVPPLSDGTNQYLVHPLTSFYLFDANGINITGAARSALIGDGVYLWDGAQYQVVPTLNSGVGYWIKNNSTTHQTLSLVRFLDTPPAGFTFPTAGIGRAAGAGAGPTLVMSQSPDAVAGTVASTAKSGYATKDIGTPPAPGGNPAPVAAAAPANHASGGCGAGSVAVLLGLFACFWLRRRRQVQQ